jgi:hypothetical protein
MRVGYSARHAVTSPPCGAVVHLAQTPHLDVVRLERERRPRAEQIIGEAVKKLSDDIKQGRPEIPWKQIAGMRDRLTHDYFGVDLALVWVVVERELPTLKAAIEALLADDAAGGDLGVQGASSSERED